MARPLPWTADDVLAVVHKHWMAAFRHVLPRATKDDVKRALDSLRRPHRAGQREAFSDLYAPLVPGTGRPGLQRDHKLT